MRTNFHYLLISSSLSPRITLGRAYTLVLLDILLFFLPNSVISMFSQLKNSAPGKIKLSKLYFCLGCFSPHFSSYHAFTSWMDVLFLDSEISILCRRSDISPVHTCDSLGVRLFSLSSWKSDSLGVSAAAASFDRNKKTGAQSFSRFRNYISPHFSSCYAFSSSRGDILCQTLWEFWQLLQVLIGTKKPGAIISLFLIILAIILFIL